MAAEAAAVQLKWEGKATEEVAGSMPDQVWPLLADFCNLHKVLPILDKCFHVGGPPGEPGMIRRCVPASPPPPPAAGEEKKAEAGWIDEKLVAIDPAGRWLSYEIVSNTMGIKAYVGTMKVLETDDASKKECRIEWSFVSDPIQGLSFEEFLGSVQLGLKAMAKKIEETLGGAA